MNRKSLLVVDDSATFRQLICMGLGRIDGVDCSSITEAVDGEDALNKMMSRRFDLVLTDIRMPRMNGLEFVQRVRGNPGLNDLPIIIISTKGAEEEIREGLSLGASGYLSKPVSMHRLRELVVALLKER